MLSGYLHQGISSLADRCEIIIDGGRITWTARAAVVATDCVVAPTLPSRPENVSTEDFFEKVIDIARTFRNLHSVVLLYQVQGGTVMSRRSQTYTQAAQPAFAAVLNQYVAYREAFALGQSVVEYDAPSKAASEMPPCTANYWRCYDRQEPHSAWQKGVSRNGYSRGNRRRSHHSRNGA